MSMRKTFSNSQVRLVRAVLHGGADHIASVARVAKQGYPDPQDWRPGKSASAVVGVDLYQQRNIVGVGVRILP